jgi:glycosyltransferase involved in cell wall biosynthesis
MVHYSILIPQRDSVADLSRLLSELRPVLDALLLPYEVICVDDGSPEAALVALETELSGCAAARLLRFDEPRGASAALGAAIAASRGDLLIAIGAKTNIPPRYVPQLISRLSRHDLVIAHRERTPVEQLWLPWISMMRAMAGFRDATSAEDLFWAARREAAVGLGLGRGAFRLLGPLVARRGFRVCDLTLAEGLPPQGRDYRGNVATRLMASWLERRFEPHLAFELVRSQAAPQALPFVRGDFVRPRSIPSAALVDVAREHRDSA